MSHAKVPRKPPVALRRDAGDVVVFQDVLWRIHRTQGENALAWNALRTYGPLATMRYDPQPQPLGSHAEGVAYAATDFATALAEVFQSTRIVDTVSFAPQVTAWWTVRPLRLLDLTGTWALRNGAAAALNAAPHSTCRAWAGSIRSTWPDLDGLWASSTMTGGHDVVLWNPAVGSFPDAPAFSRRLAHPVIKALVARIAVDDLGYGLL